MHQDGPLSIVAPLSSPVIGLLGEIASLEYVAGEVGPLVGSHEGITEVPLVLLDECRRPGFPAVWVAFPGHVGPGFTAKGLSVSSIDHYGIARR